MIRNGKYVSPLKIMLEKMALRLDKKFTNKRWSEKRQVRRDIGWLSGRQWRKYRQTGELLEQDAR